MQHRYAANHDEQKTDYWEKGDHATDLLSTGPIPAQEGKTIPPNPKKRSMMPMR